MDLKRTSLAIQRKLIDLFADSETGVLMREDSRAFGAMIEKRITENWPDICKSLGYVALDQPGRRTIYDCAFYGEKGVIGVDVKTKDLDSRRYSDGGICSVGNLLKFLANEKGTLLIAEVGHSALQGQAGLRKLQYIHVAPLTMLPASSYRIENLGTGQMRLNGRLDEIWKEIVWTREIDEFYDLIVGVAVKHYEKVSAVADARKGRLLKFQESGYDFFPGR